MADQCEVSGEPNIEESCDSRLLDKSVGTESAVFNSLVYKGLWLIHKYLVCFNVLIRARDVRF